MVEDEAAETHVVVASPPTIFDVAVIARTLYTGLGPKGWRLYIVGLGRRLSLKLLTESRLPVSVARENIVLDTLPARTGGLVVTVDPRGSKAYEVKKTPSILVVDYGESVRHLFDATPVSTLGLPSITYEATAAIYEFFIRRRVRPIPRGDKAYSSEPRSGLYLARKLLEAISVFDNYTLLEPSVVVHTLRRVLLSRGLIIEPVSYSVSIKPVNGSIIEVINITVYDKRLKERGHARIAFDGTYVDIVCCGEEIFRIEIDPERRVACAAPGLCAGAERGPGGEGEATWPGW